MKFKQLGWNHGWSIELSLLYGWSIEEGELELAIIN